MAQNFHQYAAQHKFQLNQQCGLKGPQKGGKIKPPIAKSICAPGQQDGTEVCYNKDQLVHIIRNYNMSHSDKIKETGTKRDLWARISNKMATACKNHPELQICIATQPFVTRKDELLSKVFKSERPMSESAWLTTSDILKTLKQYEAEYPDYAFLGTVAMDFCTITPNGGVCGVNLKSAWRNGKRKLAAVFNTDPHDKPGQHWVSMFVDLANREINYYDSFGKLPIPDEIVNFINIIRSQAGQFPGQGDFIVKINTCRHQQNNSECGVYSINFIVERLLGKSWEEIMDEQLLDDEINQRRKLYFRPRY